MESMQSREVNPSSGAATGTGEGSPVPGVHRNVLRLGGVSFFTDVSSEMIYPLVPIFLTSVLGAPLAIVGAIEGLAESTASVMRLVSGWLSDRIGRRKPFVLVGYALAVVGKPLLALAFHWPTAMFARFVDRFGKGVRSSPRDALIGQWTDPATRGRAFGFHRAADTAGAVVGPLTALALLALLGENYRLLFVLAVIPGLMGVLLLRGVGERHASPAEAASGPPQRWTDFGGRYYAFLFLCLLFAVGNSSDAFLILRARDVGLSVSEAVLAYVLYNAVYAVLSLPAGVASDRLGRRAVIGLGFAIFAVVYFGFALVDAGGYVWGLFAVYGVYMAMTEGVGRALVTDFVGARWRGTALGLYQGSMGLMLLLSSIFAGVLWDRIGPAAPFMLGGSTAALAAVLAFPLLPGRSAVNEP